MKPKIGLVSHGILPVPAVKGGAIETLVQILAEENEKEQKLELLILSVYDPLAEQIAEQFKCTRFIFIKIDNPLERIGNFIIWAINGLTKKYGNGREFFCTSYFLKCFKILRREKPDFIVNECGNFQKFIRLMPYFRKEQLYIHLHGHVIPHQNIYTIFGGLIGVSKFVTHEFMKSAQDTAMKSYTVMNCINEEVLKKRISPSEYTTLQEDLGFFRTDFIVLFCGRIIEVKGIRELMKAIHQIQNKDIRLLIVGSPNFGEKKHTPYLSEIESLVKQSKDKIIFTGYIKQEELHKYYQIADILVVPSLCEEACPLVPLEGLTSGLPILATKSGGMPEVVSPESAILVNRDEHLIDNLAFHIEYVYKNEQQRRSMAEAALKESARFSRKKYYHEFTAVFQ